MTTTFLGEPNFTVGLNPKIGLIRHVRFDDNGEFSTDDERMIKRFMDRPELFTVKTESLSCKKCGFTTGNKGILMSHYRSEHPKEENHE